MNVRAFIKSIGGPGSLGFLVFSALIGLVLTLAGRRARLMGKIWLTVILVLYVILSLPVVANTLVNGLAPPPMPADVTLRAVRTLFVLDGDNRLGRIEAARRVVETAEPEMVWLLGGRYMVPDVVMAGTPRNRVRVDFSATDTFAQVARVKALIVSTHAPAPAVIASRIQMRRVEAFARATGLQVVLVASPLDGDLPQSGWSLLVPRSTP